MKTWNQIESWWNFKAWALQLTSKMLQKDLHMITYWFLDHIICYCYALGSLHTLTLKFPQPPWFLPLMTATSRQKDPGTREWLIFLDDQQQNKNPLHYYPNMTKKFWIIFVMRLLLKMSKKPNVGSSLYQHSFQVS